MRIHPTIVLLIAVGTVTGCASARSHVGATPTFEVGAGVNLWQLPQAEFPGFTGSIALILPESPMWGAGRLADLESSYLIESKTAGVRVYGRSRPLFSERRTVSYFGQFLVGNAVGSVQGVLRSQGGFVAEPSVGLDYGAGARAFRVQFGYRSVRNGVVYDSRGPGDPIDRLSGIRGVFGMTWRFRPR